MKVIHKLAIFFFLTIGLDKIVGEVLNVLNFQSDVNVPMASGGDLPPDNSQDVYRRIWRISTEEIEEIERKSVNFFEYLTDINILSLAACQTSGGLFSIFSIKTQLRNRDEDLLTPLCTTRTVDGVIYVYDQRAQLRVASFYHVRNPDIVGYKLVQSLIPRHDATENPLPLFDTAFLLNILEDGYFTCSKFNQFCVKGDRFLYGWYTIRDLYNKGEWGVIHYESRGPQNILKQFTPLSFVLESSVWGKGVSNGFVSRRYANNDIVQPCYENSCPYRMPKMFDTISVSFRNVLTFISP